MNSEGFNSYEYVMHGSDSDLCGLQAKGLTSSGGVLYRVISDVDEKGSRPNKVLPTDLRNFNIEKERLRISKWTQRACLNINRFKIFKPLEEGVRTRKRSVQYRNSEVNAEAR